MVELRDLKGDLARSRADADAVKEQVARHKERLARLDENLHKRGVPDTREAADQKVQLGKLDEKLDKNLIETARASQGVADQQTHLNGLESKRHSRAAVVRVGTKSGPRAKLGQRTGRSLAIEEGRRTSHSGRG